VTQEEYEKVQGVNPSSFSATGADRKAVNGMNTLRFPVERVSWEDAIKFCERLSNLADEKLLGRTYRLPTEAEWEYACRAGGKEATPFSFGSALSSLQANLDGRQPYRAAIGNSPQRPMPVGSYAPNALGLFDMHGNVWEWTADWYDKDAYLKPPFRNPAGPANGSFRILRGGSWQDPGKDCRSAVRHHSLPTFQNRAYGFRVVLDTRGGN
ncbi:MAG: SUMF1/EgtB/PvdO family nonheme iron enzyme, partial [Planctomycetia bacterium]|nr:SUMF1/EgtB/PvdO family nonheme iron enzyme [Planctomycetia bacterium]